VPGREPTPGHAWDETVRQIVVDIAALEVTGAPETQLVTYSLGSCIGLVIYDPVVKVGGMLHYMLPESSLDPAKARQKPGMFADTGIPMLFKTAYRLGLEKRRARVVVAGGAQVLDASDTFKIGKRNYAALRKIFWKNHVLVDAEDVGGCTSRTVFLDLDTGQVRVRNGRQQIKIL
jgi:chemotaxis protein CheD